MPHARSGAGSAALRCIRRCGLPAQLLIRRLRFYLERQPPLPHSNESIAGSSSSGGYPYIRFPLGGALAAAARCCWSGGRYLILKLGLDRRQLLPELLFCAAVLLQALGVGAAVELLGRRPTF